MDDPLIAACAVELPTDASAPDWVQLLPAGNISAIDGRSWRLEDAEQVIARSQPGAVKLVICYDHGADRPGGSSEAAGWITELASRNGAIWGRVEWTDPGREKLARRPYRYISPVFEHRRDGTVQRILRASLTNTPAIHELAAVASSSIQLKGSEGMTDLLKSLAAALGAEPFEDTDAAFAAVTALARRCEGAEQVATAARTALALDGKADGDAIAAAVADLKAGEKSLAEQVRQVSSELTELKRAAADEKAQAAVAHAVREGKIAPAMKDWALRTAKRDLAEFEAFCAAQPIIVKPGADAVPACKRKHADTLDDVEQAVCAALGLSKSAFIAARAQIEETA